MRHPLPIALATVLAIGWIALPATNSRAEPASANLTASATQPSLAGRRTVFVAANGSATVDADRFWVKFTIHPGAVTPDAADATERGPRSVRETRTVFVRHESRTARCTQLLTSFGRASIRFGLERGDSSRIRVAPRDDASPPR